MCWKADDFLVPVNQGPVLSSLTLAKYNAPIPHFVFWLSLLCKVWICCINQTKHEAEKEHLRELAG